MVNLFFQEVRHRDCSPQVPSDKKHLWAGLYTAQYVFICGRDRGGGSVKGCPEMHRSC